MVAECLSFRQATPEDAPPLAELINFAGEGLPLYLWKKMAEEGQSAWEIGYQRAQREEGGFSYRNTTVATIGDHIAACLTGYVIGDTPEEITPDIPPLFVPLIELENKALNSWYVNVLASYPEHRNQGIGAELLIIAETKARQENLNRLSIIVSDANQGAKRLYERSGFQLTASAPMVKEDWENDGKNWILMLKHI